MTTEPTLGRVVGQNARRLRLEADSTLEDVGRAARQLGVNWSASRVQAVERGAREPKLATLATLAHVLGCSLRELVRTDVGEFADAEVWVDLGGVSVNGADLPKWFAARVKPTLVGEELSTNEWLAQQGWGSEADVAADLRASAVEYLTVGSFSDHELVDGVRELLSRFALVDERTARLLDVAPAVLAHLLLHLGKGTVGEWRDHELGADATQAEKATATERLRERLRQTWTFDLTPEQRHPARFEKAKPPTATGGEVPLTPSKRAQGRPGAKGTAGE